MFIKQPCQEFAPKKQLAAPLLRLHPIKLDVLLILVSPQGHCR